MTSQPKYAITIFDHSLATEFESNRDFAHFSPISYSHSLEKHPHQLISHQSTIISPRCVFPVTMKERTLASPGLGDAITRDHSPYCESKGPIIQEGFVAQRIRALQELQAHALAGNCSHSPMIPCPPGWVRSYEPLSPPKSVLAPRPAVKVSTMSDYGAIKHHWASMVGGPSNDMIEWPNLSATTHLHARRSQRPPQSAERDEPLGVITKAIEGIDSSSKTSPSSEHYEQYRSYIRPTESTRGIDMIVERQGESRVIESEEPHAVPTNITETVGSAIEQSADSQGVLADELRTTPTKTTQGNESAVIVPNNGQKVDQDEPQNGPTRTTQRVDSTSGTPPGSQRSVLYEVHATSRMSSQGNSLAVGERASSERTDSTESPSQYFRISPKFDDIIRIPPRKNMPTPSECEVLGPNPIPASLADPSVLSRCISLGKPQHSDLNNDYVERQMLQQPHKSVADKLGFLVERDWVGCDVFGTPYNHTADSGSVWTTSRTSGDRADFRYMSLDQGPTHSSRLSSNGGSESHRFLEHDKSHMGETTPISISGLATPLPRNIKKRELHRTRQTFPFERSSSHVRSGSVKTSVSSPTSKRRVFSLQQLYRLRRSNSEGIELRRFSQGSTASSKHDYASAKLSSPENVSSESNLKDIMPEHKLERIVSASASLGPRSRRSSISANKYVRSSSRSTSWFRKSWLKTLLGDGDGKSTHGKDPMEKISNSISASVSTDGGQQDPSSRFMQQLSRDTGTTCMLANSDQSGESEDASTCMTIEPVAKQHKSQDLRPVTTSINEGDLPLTRHGQKIAHRVQSLSDSPHVSPFSAVSHEPPRDALRQRLHNHARKPSEQSEKSMTSLSIPLPSRQSSERTATASKSASLVSRNTEKSLRSPQRKSSPILQTPRKLSPMSSTSISVRIHRNSRLAPVPLGHARGDRKAGSTAEQLQQQAPEKEAAHLGLGRERALKKIQVIISFDGAEDLIIEATAEGDAMQGSSQP